MKTVPLGGKKAAGRVALVDDEDYELVMAHRWYVDQGNHGPRRALSGPYAMTNIVRSDGRRTTLRMHRLITGWPKTDHINQDGLDNRRSNLRPASKSQNAANQRPRRGCVSPYKGVCWDRRRRKWTAQIKASGRHIYLGLFITEDDAARAYDAAAIAAWGEYACINFAPVVAP